MNITAFEIVCRLTKFVIAKKHSREKLIWKFISRFVEEGVRLCTRDSEFNKCLLPFGGLDECNYKTLSDRISSESFKACFTILIVFMHLKFVYFLLVIAQWNEMRIFIHRFLLCVNNSLKECLCFFNSLHFLSRLFSISIFSFQWFESRAFLRSASETSSRRLQWDICEQSWLINFQHVLNREIITALTRRDIQHVHTFWQDNYFW